MHSERRANGGEQAARLMLVAATLALVNNYLPGSEHLDVVVLDITAGIGILLGLVGLFVPWRRLPARAPLVLVVAAFALIAASNLYGGVSAFSYAVYFVVVFVWVGLYLPPGTSFWLAPLATAAYLLPFLLQDERPPTAIGSVTVAIPVCVLVGEVLARAVRRLEHSREELRARVEVVERLATLTGELGRDLDAEAVSRRLVDSAMQIFGARAVVFGKVDGDEVLVTAAAGLPASYLGRRVPLAGTLLAQAADADRLLVTPASEVPALPGPAGGSALTVACVGGELLGGLTVLLDRPVGRVTSEDEDVLRLLGAQGAAALMNAARHGEVVRQREHEQAVVDVLADGVLVLSPDGTVSACNTAAAVLLGAPAADLVGRRPPFAVGGPGTVEEHELSPGRWAEALAAVLPDTGELVVALRDTSRQRALDEAKDLFLATTSHELRTPLTAIKGFVSTLQRRWDVLGEEARLEALATIGERTDVLVELTNHLLMGARARVSSFVGTPFDLGAVVATAVATYSRVSDLHELVADVPPALPLALGDAAGVDNILAQLLENAIKYSPAGGEVTVVVRLEGGALAVAVLDRGVGIPAGREESLFTPFYQAAAANTRQFGGVGLGLYIVRQLVEAQGGSVTASPRPGGGAVLRFTVPVAAGATVAERPGTAARPA